MKNGFFEPSYVYKPFVPVIPTAKTDADKFPDIDKELSKYPSSLLLEFVRLFPTESQVFGIPIPMTIQILVKGRQVGATTMAPFSHSRATYLYFDSEEDFWKRWNRFKNMRAFL